MEALIKKYNELYDDMATAKDPMKMMAFGEAEKWVFHMMAEKHPELAEQWLDKLEAMRWNNYLSRSEAEFIVSSFVSQDGTRGAHWGYETFKAAVESLGGKVQSEPYYNCYALWVTANMLYSDHYASASEFVPKDRMPKYFYAMAVETLKDPDRPRFIRRYFDV
jgi:hypothetical protein